MEDDDFESEIPQSKLPVLIKPKIMKSRSRKVELGGKAKQSRLQSLEQKLSQYRLQIGEISSQEALIQMKKSSLNKLIKATMKDIAKEISNKMSGRPFSGADTISPSDAARLVFRGPSLDYFITRNDFEIETIPVSSLKCPLWKFSAQGDCFEDLVNLWRFDEDAHTTTLSEPPSLPLSLDTDPSLDADTCGKPVDLFPSPPRSRSLLSQCLDLLESPAAQQGEEAKTENSSDLLHKINSSLATFVSMLVDGCLFDDDLVKDCLLKSQELTAKLEQIRQSQSEDRVKSQSHAQVSLKNSEFLFSIPIPLSPSASSSPTTSVSPSSASASAQTGMAIQVDSSCRSTASRGDVCDSSRDASLTVHSPATYARDASVLADSSVCGGILEGGVSILYSDDLHPSIEPPSPSVTALDGCQHPPDFHQMTLAELQQLADSYGLKKDCKERLVVVLSSIWSRMNHSQSLGRATSRHDESEWMTRVTEVIRSDTELYQKILLFDPLRPELVMDKLRPIDLAVGMKKLREYLVEEKVFIKQTRKRM